MGDTSKFRHQKSDIKQLPYCGPRSLKWPVNFCVIWHFLLGACEMTHIYICMEIITKIKLKISGANAQNFVAADLCIHRINCTHVIKMA